MQLDEVEAQVGEPALDRDTVPEDDGDRADVVHRSPAAASFSSAVGRMATR
ncbi:hypothetical protein [Trebonia kvetii]|uniref:hypothetical protein n=1 Tax=Trebonia kvetii TaxID=2480626 RepID=UPI00165220D1|nr:hypothetical protein [Trebonia kvetii]